LVSKSTKYWKNRHQKTKKARNVVFNLKGRIPLLFYCVKDIHRQFISLKWQSAKVRWLWLRKIDFLYFLCVERHWYTSVQNIFIFWKFFFMASLDAETHFTRAELFSRKIEGWISANCRAALSQNAWLFPNFN
jgi:hypothetical protein